MTVSKHDNGNTSVFAVMESREKAIKEHTDKLKKDSFYKKLFEMTKKGRRH